MIALTLTDDYPDDDFPPFGSGWFYIFFKYMLFKTYVGSKYD